MDLTLKLLEKEVLNWRYLGPIDQIILVCFKISFDLNQSNYSKKHLFKLN